MPHRQYADNKIFTSNKSTNIVRKRYNGCAVLLRVMVEAMCLSLFILVSVVVCTGRQISILGGIQKRTALCSVSLQ